MLNEKHEICDTYLNTSSAGSAQRLEIINLLREQVYIKLYSRWNENQPKLRIHPAEDVVCLKVD